MQAEELLDARSLDQSCSVIILTITTDYGIINRYIHSNNNYEHIYNPAQSIWIRELIYSSAGLKIN